jgi:hypothetical protein
MTHSTSNSRAAIPLAGLCLILGGLGVEAQSPSPIVGALIDPVALRGVEDVHLDGDYAYLPCREGKRLTVCSIQDPANPKVVSSFTHTELGHAAGFAISGDIVYLTSQSNHKLLIVDVSNKSNLRLLSAVRIGPPGKGILYKVAHQAGYCYVAHLTEKKLFVVDVRDPRQPSVISSIKVTQENDGPFNVLLHGRHAFVGTIFGRQNRLAVVDISAPTKPLLVDKVLGPEIGHASGEIVGDLFFAVNWDKNAFLVFDVANIAKPKLAAKLIDKRLGKPNRCVVSGDRAYLPMVEGDGVAVVDIANPLKPRFLRSFRDSMLNKTYGVAVRDGLLYVGAREGNSLVIFDRHALEE